VRGVKRVALAAVVACSSARPAPPPARTHAIASVSMMPTFAVGKRLTIVPHATYARGDVIAYRYPCDRAREFVKRIVAVAGDAVEVRCGILHVGGAAMHDEPVDVATCSYVERVDGRDVERRCARYRERIGDRAFEIFRDDGDAHDFPRRLDGSSAPGCGDPHQAAGRVVDAASGAPPCGPQRHYVVPDGHVFVLGDNRANSNDSREWGSVPLDDVLGIAE
jgi:signal peptidase I